MPAAAVLGVIGAIGSVASAVGSTVTAGNRRKYAQYMAPDAGNFSFDNPNKANEFYNMALGAQNREVDPYARQKQMDLIGQLQGAAEGQGPVQAAAQKQLQAGKDQAVKTAMALAGSNRGNPGNALYGASQQATQAVQQTGNAAAQQMAQTQLGALGQLGGVIGGMRSQDLAEAQRKDQLEEFYTKMGASREEAALRAKMQMEQERGQRQMEFQRLSAEEEAGKVAGIQKGFNAMGQGFAQLGAAGGSMGRGGGEGAGGGHGAG